MATRKPAKSKREEGRYLDKRSDGGFRYQRFVPGRFQALDGRRMVKLSLHTHDIIEARLRRDAQEEADNAYWEELAAGAPAKAAEARYRAATARARAMGFVYAPAAVLATTAPLSDLVARLERLADAGGASAPDLDIAALTGTAAAPAVTVSQAFRIYFEDIEAGQLISKSPQQYKNWRKVKERARENFIAVAGDKPIDQIARADAQAFYKFWQRRIAAGEVTVNSAARDFGNLRVVFHQYMKWIDRPDMPNPFRNMSFSGDVTKSRAPFETAFIAAKFLQPGPIQALNPQARALFLALVETGCRPSEIANLRPAQIRLEAAVPHISIEPSRGMEIKTRSSIRQIPLVGVSLAALQRWPSGFPRYFDKPDALSQTLMKWLRTQGLLPTPAHKVYSLRHSFKKRCKEAGLSDELFDTLMGHASGKPVYGDGGALEWRRSEMLKIALPFAVDIFE